MSKTPIRAQDLGRQLESIVRPFIVRQLMSVPNTQISGRAQIVDMRQDLMPRFGVERVIIQQADIVQNERGPTQLDGTQGEVRRDTNDPLDRTRIVGRWIYNQNEGTGTLHQPKDLEAFIEITFWGTGLNLVTVLGASTYSAVASVDGGAEGVNFITNSNANPTLGGRNYNTLQIVNVINGLTQGLHTVKIRNTDASNGFPFYGYEVLNTNTNIVVTPGTLMTGGKSVTLTAAASTPYNSAFETGTVGTRGGRALIYLKTDGTVGKSFQPADSQLNLAVADHSNEEMIRQFHWREFSAARADDFYQDVSNNNRAQVLDDGVTMLQAQNVDFSSTLDLRMGTITGYIQITFVGTGLDWRRYEDSSGTADTFGISVDGISIGNSPVTAANSTKRWEKIVSGLPYGTHVVRITYNTSGTQRTRLTHFQVWAPKRPALPTGATSLAEYYLMATNTRIGAPSALHIGAGTLRQTALRGIFIGGNVWSIGLGNGIVGGFELASQSTNKSIQFTFWGTGFDMRFAASSNRSAVQPVLLNGVALNAAYPGANTIQCSVDGTGIVFGGQTGSFLLSAVANNQLDQQDASADAGCSFRVSNLPLGLYTINITDTSANFSTVNCFDVISPVHSPKLQGPFIAQSAAQIRESGMIDLRTFSVLDVPVAATSCMANGFTSDPATATGNGSPLPEMHTVIKTTGKPIEVTTQCSIANGSTGQGLRITVYVDGNVVGSGFDATTAVGGYRQTMGGTIIVPVSAGIHYVQVHFGVPGGGIATANGGVRTLSVREVN